jgi:hypothetical protein
MLIIKLIDSSTHICSPWQNVAMVQPSEDTGVVATDEKDLVALQFRMAALGFGQHLYGGDLDAEDLGCEGDGRVVSLTDHKWCAMSIIRIEILRMQGKCKKR